MGNIAVGVMAMLASKSLVAAAAAAATAYFTTAGTLGPVGAAMLAAAPIAIPALIGIAAAAVSGMASAKEGGITSQEGLVNVHPQEAIVPIEKLGGMIADAMEPLRRDMKSYFGFGGSAVQGIGKSVQKGFTDVV